jgi:hypothetical protein
MKPPRGIARFLGRLLAPVVLATIEQIDKGERAKPVKQPRRLRRPRTIDADPEIRAMIVDCYRAEKTLDDTIAAVTAKYGLSRAPSRSALGRYFQHLARLNGADR